MGLRCVAKAQNDHVNACGGIMKGWILIVVMIIQSSDMTHVFIYIWVPKARGSKPNAQECFVLGAEFCFMRSRKTTPRAGAATTAKGPKPEVQGLRLHTQGPLPKAQSPTIIVH